MDSNHIHIFLEKILANEQCPKCNAKIEIGNISVQSVSDKTCLFKIHCSECHFDSIAQAVINIVSDKKHPDMKNISPTEISEEEVNTAQKTLESNPKSLSAFFEKK